MIRVSTYANPTQRRRVEVVLELVLPYDLRKKSRLRTWSQCGKEIGLFLERGNILKAGDELRAESGELIRIRAADETVSEARCDDLLLMLKGAYHLGNRHVPLQIGPLQIGPLQHDNSDDYWLRYQPDYVLDDMLRGMGLTVTQQQAPFHPESGAYATPVSAAEFKLVQAHSHYGHSENGHAHEHDHHHGHSHSHGHHHHG